MSELSNETLTEQYRDLKKSISDFRVENKTSHDDIIKHQKETNGRVKVLEVWKAGIIGAISILTLLIGLFGFLLQDWF
ncbi:MAG: hypothetical protein GY861_18110 [bacterium]|nr:hypothetical protein [bacterium]